MNKKIIMSSLSTVLLVTGAMSSTTSVFAQENAQYEKDENVYGCLSADGTPNKVYVINQFEVEKAGVITDSGDYSSIENLTNQKEIKKNQDKYTFDVNEGYFYYQGEYNENNLPWNFQIEYYLDDIKIEPEDLAGKTGKLTIHITSNRNDKVDEVFYKNYMMQISMTLSNDKTSNIQAEGASIASAVDSKQINFTILPEKDANIFLEADVEEFEMTGISIAAVPFSMSMEFPDTSEMSNGMNSLADGVSQINDGTQSLSEGTVQLANGIAQLYPGLHSLSRNFTKVVGGADDLVNASTGIAQGLENADEKLKQTTTDISNISSDLDEIQSTLDSTNLSTENPELYANLKMAIESADTKTQLALQNSSIAYQTVNGLNSNYQGFHEGLSQFSNGLPEVQNGLNSLDEGLNKINEGGQELANGSKELASGTLQMAQETSKLPEEMQNEMDSMMNDYVKDFDPTSFVSAENKNVEYVQFIISTSDIKISENKKTEVKEEKKGLIERFLDLFN